jgi:site-specific DNA-methyltransferase (cytosine-N4-specific)
MPESVTDRPTKAHEYLFLLSKSERYYYDADAVREPLADVTIKTHGTRKKASDWGNLKARGTGDKKIRTYGMNPTDLERGRNKRTVWTVATRPYKGAHFATFPPDLVKPCILAGSRPGDTVLDPFAGSGTTLAVAEQLQRQAIGVELNPAYIELIKKRLDNNQVQLMA